MNKFLSYKYTLVCTLFTFSILYGQSQHRVSGTVRSETREGLPGVSIIVKGTSIGTVTNADGFYELEAPDRNATLVYSFIGYNTQDVAINGQNLIEISLQPNIQELSEVVVVGYGTQERKNVTGAVSSVKGAEIENIPVSSANAILQGRVAGVQIIQNSGAPGGGATVRIRGTNSISASNEPLYVIDGVPVKNYESSGLNDTGNGGASSMNPLSDINPNDIESIDVLKDASSAAIYGARASNGVVLITTKKGKSGAPSLTLNYYRGVQEVIRRIPVLNARQMRSVIIEQNINGNNPGGNDILYDSLNPWYGGDLFWQDEILREAPITNYDLALRGGGEKATYALSLGYFDQEGVIINTGFKRITARLNNEFKATNKIKIGQNISFSRAYTQRTSDGGSGRSVLNAAVVKLPVFPIYDINGNFFPEDNINRQNPVAVAENAVQDAFTNRLIGNLYAEAQLTKALTFRTSFQLDFLSLKEDRFFPSTIALNESRDARSNTNIDMDWINDYTLNYTKTFNQIHTLSALGGFSHQQNKTESILIDAGGSPTNSIHTIDASGVAVQNARTRIEKWGLVSQFARFNYSFDDRYLLSFNVRRDGSSRFGEDNKYGIFPSASAGWRISSEPFASGLSTIDNLLLRVSYGTVGNQDGIGNYAWQGRYSSGANYITSFGIAPSTSGLSNPGLSWETAKKFNAGLDLSLLQGKINFISEYYVNTTEDLLLQVDLPRTSGYRTLIQNVGSIRNKGWEFSVNSRNVDRKLKWTTSANISFNRTEVLKLNSGQTELAGPVSQTLTRVGLPVGTFYGWNALGVYSTIEDTYLTQVGTDDTGNPIYDLASRNPGSDVATDASGNPLRMRNINGNGTRFSAGDVIFEDVDRNGIINDNDRQIIGDPTPDFIGGVNNTFSYKGIELSVFLQFSYGNDIYNAFRLGSDATSSLNNTTTDLLRRWTKPGDITDVPRPMRGDAIQNARHSTRWVEDGSYLRFKTVTLGYNFDKAIVQKLWMNSLRIYATGQNLLTFTDYKGFDPEVNGLSSPLAIGVDTGVFPQARTFIFGINAGF